VGDSYTASGSVTIAADTAPGAYHVLVQTDAGSTLTESDETNNVVGAPTSLNVGGPDLTIQGSVQLNDGGGNYRSSFQIFTPFSFVGSGSTLDVSYQVLNAGLGVASQPWSNQVWLSRDNHPRQRRHPHRHLRADLQSARQHEHGRPPRRARDSGQHSGRATTA